jgi:hypothetical protein
MYFDGANDKLDITDSVSLQSLTGFSMELWLYPKSIGGDASNRVIFTSGITAAGNFYARTAAATAGQIDFRVTNDLTTLKNAVNNNFKPASEWHHVVCVYTGAAIIVYVDGTAGTPGAQTGTVSPTGNWKISDSTTDYSGLIDEIRFYRRPLSADEILNLYMQGKP